MPNIRAHIGKFAALHLHKKLRYAPPRPVITFTFDDFPRSALHTAGGMLVSEGVRGTYYASLGLMNSTTSVGSIFTAADLSSLLEQGHDLGCHTHSHVSCLRTAIPDIQADCARNRSALQGLVPEVSMRNFAYPYGDVTSAAKELLACQYATCRSTKPGINSNRVDAAYLHATPLYVSTPMAVVESLVRECIADCGWLIFYTHDVADRPSPFGCTPAQFRQVLSFALQSGAEIATISDVGSRLSPFGRNEKASSSAAASR